MTSSKALAILFLTIQLSLMPWDSGAMAKKRLTKNARAYW